MVTLQRTLKKLGGASFGAVALLSFAALPHGLQSSTKPSSRERPFNEELESLGKAIFNDTSLSNPPGLACASCHAAETGYTHPDEGVHKGSALAPGAAKGRFGHRKPPTVAYASFMPQGIPHWDDNMQAYVGGLFWDGRAPNAEVQAAFPLTDPDEMNNCEFDGTPRIDLVVEKLKSGPSADTFKRLFGDKVFDQGPQRIFEFAARAIVAYESSEEVSPFTSKFDAYLEGKASLTDDEIMGMRFVTGLMTGKPGSLPFRHSMHCMDCHGGTPDNKPNRYLWSHGCYANLGIPHNPAVPASDPDLGLGGTVYRQLAYPFNLISLADPFQVNGSFRAPTLRNVDKRPKEGFVKSYMHNGYFKSLKDVVHFYNARNLTTQPGEVIDFTKPDPYANLKGKPLFPQPEVIGPSLVNPGGSAGVGVRIANGDPDASQIGQLKLTDAQEDAIVAFLKTLTDGYFKR